MSDTTLPESEHSARPQAQKTHSSRHWRNNSGLWRENPALVQLLALSPLLAAANSVVMALGLSLVTLLALLISNLCVALLRHTLSETTRLVALCLVIAATASCLQFLTQAIAYDFYLAAGLYLPLVATNCLVLARADVFASRSRPLASMFDGLTMGIGTLCVMVLLGAMREAVGSGTLFADMQLLFGERARSWKMSLYASDEKFLLALLPAGAFIFTGLLIALNNIIDARYPLTTPATPLLQSSQSRRVRVTGRID